MAKRSWIKELERGDERAWRQFFEEMGPLIQAVGAGMRLSAEERDEILQLTSVRVLQRIGSLRNIDSFSSWVYGIALRFALDTHRDRRRRDQVESAAGRQGLPPDPPFPDVLARLERLEQVARVQDGMAGLGKSCRILLEALYFQDPVPSYKEISESLGLPIGSIGPTRGRCLKKLSESIPDVFDPPSRESRGGTEDLPEGQEHDR